MEATEEALPAGFWADLVAEFVEDARGLSLEEGFSLDPLGEVVSDHGHINPLAQGHWEFSDDVHPPFHERPWGDDGSELLGWKMCYLGEALAAVAPLDERDGVIPHGRPVVASRQDSVG